MKMDKRESILFAEKTDTPLIHWQKFVFIMKGLLVSLLLLATWKSALPSNQQKAPESKKGEVIFADKLLYKVEGDLYLLKDLEKLHASKTDITCIFGNSDFFLKLFSSFFSLPGVFNMEPRQKGFTTSQLKFLDEALKVFKFLAFIDTRGVEITEMSLGECKSTSGLTLDLLKARGYLIERFSASAHPTKEELERIKSFLTGLYRTLEHQRYYLQ